MGKKTGKMLWSTHMGMKTGRFEVNYVVKASIATVIFSFCAICKNVDNLYKWQTFQPKGFHQSQVLRLVSRNLALMKAFGPKHLAFIKKYGSTSYLRIGQVLKWPPIHKV